ncbi:MAG TPA: lytic transglycosylase domain-containing protein [Rhizomicrobium sp.]|nr:lytic transglycosylase domain-containing protein [Rhizomicrobium sp.]
MKATKALFVGVALSAFTTGAQPQGERSSGQPPGLVRRGGVVMMQPIGESVSGAAAVSVFGGERRTPVLRSLAAADHVIFERAAAAALAGKWAEARTLAVAARDPVIPRLIKWAYVGQKNSGASFAEIAQFLKDLPDWPGRERLFARAEEAMTPGLEPNSVILWFGDRTPQTGIGKVRLGEALIATGAIPRGEESIRNAFIESSLEPEQEDYVVARHGNLLTEDVWRQRLERLFARNELSSVRHDMPRLPGELQRYAHARLDLRGRPDLGEREVAALSPPLRDDPGIIFDQIDLLRQKNDVAAIPALLERIPAAEVARWSPSHWWSAMSVSARAALKAGYSSEAYRLAAVAAAALSRDANEYPDSQFLAGWIALRRLAEPRVALTHFENLVPLAIHPISRSRAHYWLGRAYEAAGDPASARIEYRAAAAYPAMFYGQLALMRIESAPLLHLVITPADADAVRASYAHEEMTDAIHALADLGLEAALREFAARDVELYAAAGHAKALAEDLVHLGYRDVAVRVAKQASYAGIFLPEFSHPVIAVPRYTGPGVAPETPLVLGIIRQETEFDPDAVSTAGARGIMQIMPDSAPHLVRLSGLEYHFSDLTADPQYAMRLGMVELSGDLAEWNGSYVLAAAAYNAGRGNARKWLSDIGDPRNPLADPVDWIEQIPFSETRNYVQRVLENTEVYRNRLAGRDEPLEIMRDLYRPALPPSVSGNASSEGVTTSVNNTTATTSRRASSSTSPEP